MRLWLDFARGLRDFRNMVAETFDVSLRGFCQRTPFHPFTVELVSGASFTVDHPEALMYRVGVAVYISPKGALEIFDHESVSRLIAAGDDRSAKAA